MTVNLGAVSLASGDFRAGLEYSPDAVERFRALGSESGAASALVNCGWSAHALGDDARAESWFREVISVAGGLSAVQLIAAGAVGLGVALVAGTRRGEERSSSQRLRRSATSSRPTFDDDSERQECEAAVATAKAALGEEAFAAAWARGEAMTPEEIVAFCTEPPAAERGRP